MERVPSVLGRQGRVRGLLIAPVSPRLLTAANRIGSSRRSASAGNLFSTLRPLLSAVTRWGAAMSVREQAMTGPVRVNILLVDDQPARKAPEL